MKTSRAYTPGLMVKSRVRHRTRRLLPLSGDVLVAKGDRVKDRDIVAETFLPGDVFPVNLANILSVPPTDIPNCMLKRQGEHVAVGEPLAITKGIFGYFRTQYESKVDGTLESISHVTGQVILRGKPIPIQVPAYLAGEVIDVIPGEGVVIEADVTLVQGIFGIGGEAFGPIRMACDSCTDDLTEERIDSSMRGQIVVGGARMTGRAIQKAIEVGASAVVSGGIDDEDLRLILGFDLAVAVTGTEHVGTTIIVTEGFGDIAMAEQTFKLLHSRAGDDAAVNGTTQIRAGVLRPEIVIPLSADETPRVGEATESLGNLQIGSRVRVIRDPYFGEIGTIKQMPSEPQVLPSESKARVVEIEFETGPRAIVPRANVELIGT